MFVEFRAVKPHKRRQVRDVILDGSRNRSRHLAPTILPNVTPQHAIYAISAIIAKLVTPTSRGCDIWQYLQSWEAIFGMQLNQALQHWDILQ